MATIRPYEPADLPQVAVLYERIARSGSATPAPGVAAYFERMEASPWADPEIPSLVSVDAEGSIVGALSSYVRRISIDGRPQRLACSGQLVTDPATRHGPVGALLMRKYLAGPQQVSITDGATELVRRMWGPLGGTTVQLRSLTWVKILRPAGVAADRVSGRYELGRSARALRRLAAGSDALMSRVPNPLTASAAPGGSTEPLTPELMAEHWPALSAGARLRVDYDLPYLRWLFDELHALRSRGRMHATLVRAPDGGVLGWYVAFAPAGDVGTAMQVAAAPRNVEAVLDRLFHDARGWDVIALRGRTEPQLLEAVLRRGCLLRHAGEALVHSGDPDVEALAASSRSLLTLLDGEYWMEHHQL